MFSNDAVLMPARHLKSRKQTKLGIQGDSLNLISGFPGAKKDRHQ